MRTKCANFDVYDTEKLKEVCHTLHKVYDYNYDSSRKVKLLDTVIRKLEALVSDYGTEDDSESRGY